MKFSSGIMRGAGGFEWGESDRASMGGMCSPSIVIALRIWRATYETIGLDTRLATRWRR